LGDIFSASDLRSKKSPQVFLFKDEEMINNPAKNKRQPLPVGFSDFRKLRENGYYYIDKSLFIRDVTNASAEVLLIPRPRRFGKTLNLSMLRYFYEKSDEESRSLFDGLKICDDEVFERDHGKYPVIFLTFKDAKENDWNILFEGLQGIISREVERHCEILKWKGISGTSRKLLESILDGTASKREYQDSLLVLSSQLSSYYNKQTVILIDEYDTPFYSAYIHGFYEEMISFMRNLLSGGLKDNRHLFKGVITGILRVAKASVFSGLNNLGVYTLTDNEFDTAFGFTENEVKNLLKEYGFSDKYNEISDWYNGYRFGSEVIYNPWSVLNYISRKAKPLPYWINTADTEIIDRLATRGGKELREELDQLLQESGIITKPLYESISMKDLEKTDDLLWSFLLFSGYLKVTEQTGYEMCSMGIPNREVRIIYERLVRKWFSEKTVQNQLEDMLKGLEKGDMILFERMLRVIVMQVMSFHDFSGAPEKVYHALVLGMLVWLSDKYEIRSNRESGYGRYDIMLKPKNSLKHGIIIEFKRVFEDENDTPEKVLEDALKQIEEMEYSAELEASGIKNILKIAVAFRGKELWVKNIVTKGIRGFQNPQV